MLAATYVVAAAIGFVLGPRLLDRSTSTPLARVGFALRETAVDADRTAWATLRDDVQAVRLAAKADDRDALDLVVALRGLATGGDADWARAEQACRALRWPRCDRPALEEMRKRSRP
jgi:hypothetical protein